LEKKGDGWYEVKKEVKSSKNMTKYDIKLKKDMVRGHAYIWRIELTRKPENWNKRLNLIKKKKINHKLVGALKTTPRIKVMGRKIWLCNDHIRIFDIEKSSYYGNDNKEARENSTMKLFEIVKALENKLGFLIKPFEFSVQKEHYALIKNDLAIDHNKKGVIMRIEDEEGEWLLIDDSLGMGGELETIGKNAYKNNKPLQNWWNDMKRTEFKITPSFLMEQLAETKSNFNEIGKMIKESSENQFSGELRIKQLESRIRGHEELFYQIVNKIDKLK